MRSTSTTTIKPRPPIRNSRVMVRFTTGSPICRERLSCHREKPALLKADMA
ncbi:hypothetical protein D3C76_1601950 [compost metagenome]